MLNCLSVCLSVHVPVCLCVCILISLSPLQVMDQGMVVLNVSVRILQMLINLVKVCLYSSVCVCVCVRACVCVCVHIITHRSHFLFS